MYLCFGTTIANHGVLITTQEISQNHENYHMTIDRCKTYQTSHPIHGAHPEINHPASLGYPHGAMETQLEST